MEVLYKPWPWYVAGPVIGITVPLLLLLDNKKLGVSSTLRQICAACMPAKIPLFQYNWKQDSWNLYLVAGILIGGFLGGKVFTTPGTVELSENAQQFLQAHNLQPAEGFLPIEIFNWSSLFTLKGFLMIICGGFMVGFGTRYAGGCTSGHGILGLSALQWPSLLATLSFFLGGIVFSYGVLPFILLL